MNESQIEGMHIEGLPITPEQERELTESLRPKVVRPVKLFADALDTQYICPCGYPVSHHFCAQCGSRIDWTEAAPM